MPAPAVPRRDATTLENERNAATSMGDQPSARVTVPKLMESGRHYVPSTEALLSALLTVQDLERGGNHVKSTVALLYARVTVQRIMESISLAVPSTEALLSARVTV
jgi:hypothetical protein